MSVQNADRKTAEAAQPRNVESSPGGPHVALPSEPQGREGGSASRLERRLLEKGLQAAGNPPLRIRLWNGEEIAPAAENPVASLTLRNRRAVWKLVLDPLFQFGELYAKGELEIDGDLTEILCVVEDRLAGVAERAGSRSGSGLLGRLRRPHRNTLSGSRKNIHRHYDIGNDFYELWLDERLVYTCAYFVDAERSIEQAQLDKMDHVCRKARLQPGQEVIEAGCGWGALALHAAEHYGVTVRAYNISHEQIVYARERARREGLDDRVEFVEDDWRSITGECDAFLSVGMLEHVGADNYRELGDVIDRCLRPGGRGLIHSIGRNRPTPLNPWIERRIFPGAYVPSLSEAMVIFEPHNFSIQDVENLRLHYAETLCHWLKRYEDSVETVRAMFDEEFVRTWRFYLACSIAAFETGALQLFQIVFNRGRDNHLPWTRGYQYGDVR